MEYEAIEIVALSEGTEILAGFGRMVVIEFNGEGALGAQLVTCFADGVQLPH